MQFADRQQFSPDPAIANIAEVSWSQAVANAAKATATLFVTPEHDRLHQPAEGIAATLEPQPVAESVAEEVEDMDLVLTANRLVTPSTISGPRLVQLGAALIQFTDYVPDFRTSIRVPYE